MNTTHPITADSQIPFPCWLRQNFSWKYHRIALGVRTGEYLYFGFTHYDTSPADKKPEWPAGPLNALTVTTPTPRPPAPEAPSPRTDERLPVPDHFTAGDRAAWIEAAASRIRQLERELAAMTKERDEARKDCGHQADQYSSLDEAYQQLATNHGKMMDTLTAAHGTIARLKEALERVSKEPYCNCSHQVVRDIANTALASAPETYADELAKARAEVEQEKANRENDRQIMDNLRRGASENGNREAALRLRLTAAEQNAERLAGAFLALLAFVGFHREKLPDYPESMPDLKEAQNIAAHRAAKEKGI